MEIDQRLMQKYSTTYGLIYGFILLIVGILALYWLASTSAMAVIMSFSVLLTFVIPVCVAIPFIFRLRKQIGGYWSMRQAAGAIFIMFFTAYLVYSLGNLAHSRLIDKGVNERVTKNIIRVTENFASKQNLPTEEIDERMEMMKESMEAGRNPSIGQIAQSMLFSIIIIFVAALIFAAIFKREPPMFEQVDEE